MYLQLYLKYSFYEDEKQHILTIVATTGSSSNTGSLYIQCIYNFLFNIETKQYDVFGSNYNELFSTIVQNK